MVKLVKSGLNLGSRGLMQSGVSLPRQERSALFCFGLVSSSVTSSSIIPSFFPFPTPAFPLPIARCGETRGGRGTERIFPCHFLRSVKITLSTPPKADFPLTPIGGICVTSLGDECGVVTASVTLSLLGAG